MHLLRKSIMSRRTMLRGTIGGAGVVMGLPLLEAMFDAHGEALADGSAPPRRFVSWLTANGVLLDRFEPDQVGANWSLSEQLEPLAGVKDYVNVCTGFHNLGQVGSYIGGHVEGVTALTGHPYVLAGAGYDAGGPSIDQLVADAIGGDTPVRSMQVAVSKANTFAGSGSLGTAISFRGEPGALTALPPLSSPKQVWASLFGIFPGPDAPQDDRQVRALMVDAVRAQSEALRGRLGTQDRQRLDAHLQGVDELEHKLQALPPPCIMPEEPNEENEEPVGSELITPVTHLMAELLTYALRCDITRVASVTFLGLAGETPYTEIGVSATKHLLSHDAQYNLAAREQLHQSVVYEMTRLADFVQALRDAEDFGGANLLDSTIVYATSDCSVGWLHSISRQPVILIGTGGGHLKYPGHHHQATPNDADDPNGVATSDLPTAGNISDIALACLHAYDPSATSFGGGEALSTDPLDGLLA